MDTGSSAYVTPSLAQIISAVSEGVPSPNFRQPHVTHFFHCTLSSGHPERSRKKLVAPPLPQRDRLRAVNGFQGGGGWPKVRQVSPCPMEATGREGSSFTEGPGKAGDLGLIPGSGRSPGEGHGNSLQYSCLENPLDRGGWPGYSPWGCKESDPD